MKYLFLTLTTVVLLAGCVSSEAGFPHTAYADVYTRIEKSGAKDTLRIKTSVNVNLEDGDGFNMVPVVLTNSDTLPLWYAHVPQEFYYYKDSTNHQLGNSVVVKVVYDDGSIKGSLIIPDTFKITYPVEDTGIVSKNASYTVVWTTSNGADWYNVSFSLRYSYYKNGNWYYVNIDTSFPTRNTLHDFPANYLFPDYVDSVDWSYGSFSVSAYSGPMMWPGEMINNMDGKGKGYYTIETNDDRNHKTLKVEGSSYKAQGISEESSYEHTKKTIEIMKKSTGGNSPSLSRN